MKNTVKKAITLSVASIATTAVVALSYIPVFAKEPAKIVVPVTRIEQTMAKGIVYPVGGNPYIDPTDPGPNMNLLLPKSNDPIFKLFNYSTDLKSGSTHVVKAHAKETYDDVTFITNLTTEEIAKKFGLRTLQKNLLRVGFGEVPIEFTIYNGDGTQITKVRLD